MTKRKPIRAWALSAPQNPIVLWAIAETKEGVANMVRQQSGDSLDTWYKSGYRIRRIKIEVEE